MPLPLRELLESISKYRHGQFANDPAAAADPPNFAYVIAGVGGKRWHVLSRIQASGLDHTNRANFFAHHIAIESEGCQADPAWLLGQAGVMLDAWDYRTEELAACRTLPIGREAPRPCSSWAAVTGDAGWAGMVAQQLTLRKPAYIIFNGERQMLPLVSEITALLPEKVRWQATFSTYFCSLPQGIECQLRCVLAGSPEARAAATQNAFLVDLTKPLGSPSESPWVDSARTGRLSATEPKSSRPGKVAQAPAAPVRESAPRKSRLASLQVQDYPLQEDYSDPAPAPVATMRRSVPAPRAYAPEPKPRAEGWALWLPIGLVSGILLSCLVLVPILLSFRSQGATYKQEKDTLSVQSRNQQETISKLTEDRNDAQTKVATATERLKAEVDQKNELNRAAGMQDIALTRLRTGINDLTRNIKENRDPLDNTIEDLKELKTVIETQRTNLKSAYQAKIDRLTQEFQARIDKLQKDRQPPAEQPVPTGKGARKSGDAEGP